MARWLAVSVFLVLAAKAFAQDAQKAPSVSAEDCAVLAEAGKAEFHWGAVAPDKMMWPNSFGADCDWQAHGMAAPVIAPPQNGPYYEGLRFGFNQPAYSEGGMTAKIVVGIAGNASATHYFFTDSVCTTRKKDGKWQPAICVRRIIT